MKKEFKLFVAQKAIIVKDGKVLIIREASTYEESTNIGKWGVPGGRIRPGEKIVEALQREVFEETGLKIQVGQPIHVDEWFPEVKGEYWHIVATFREGKVEGDESVKLSNEHDSYAWIEEKDIGSYNLMTEDVIAIKEYFNR